MILLNRFEPLAGQSRPFDFFSLCGEGRYVMFELGRDWLWYSVFQIRCRFWLLWIGLRGLLSSYLNFQVPNIFSGEQLCIYVWISTFTYSLVFTNDKTYNKYIIVYQYFIFTNYKTCYCCYFYLHYLFPAQWRI